MFLLFRKNNLSPVLKFITTNREGKLYLKLVKPLTENKINKIKYDIL